MLQVDGLVKNPSPSPDLPDLPDEDTYGVPVVSGEMDFFRPILARVVSGWTYTRFGRTFGGERGWWTRRGSRSVERGKYSGGFFSRFFYVFIPFLVSNDTMLVFGREWDFLDLSQITPMSKNIFNVYIVYVLYLFTNTAYDTEFDIRENVHTNEYPNIFVSTSLHERISEYICTQNLTRTNVRINICIEICMNIRIFSVFVTRRGEDEELGILVIGYIRIFFQNFIFAKPWFESLESSFQTPFYFWCTSLIFYHVNFGNNYWHLKISHNSKNSIVISLLDQKEYQKNNNCWQNISNTIILIQMAYIPQLLAVYILYKCIF